MKIYDLTLSHSSDLALWPKDPPFEKEPLYQLEAGEPVNISRLAFSSHLGTHVDAPLHFFKDGKSVDQLDWEALMGPALVLDCGEAPVVELELLRRLLPEGAPTRLLLKTRNSAFLKEPQLREDYTGLSLEAAQWLTEQGTRFVGIDYLTIGSPQDNLPVHRALLAAETVIAEGLDLAVVPAGTYELLCLPLKVLNGDGAPARTLLIRR